VLADPVGLTAIKENIAMTSQLRRWTPREVRAILENLQLLADRPRHGVGVYGRNPTASGGRCFRESVAAWHPLWNYVLQVAPWVARNVSSGRRKFRGGLCSTACTDLANILTAELSAGTVRSYVAHSVRSQSEDSDFSIANVVRFRDFLASCGGFEL
jgi:hypothetical protein